MKRPWKLAVSLLAAVVMTVLLASLQQPETVTAANPTTMSFQGKVVNANGTNVTDGTYGFVFKLYTVSSGGSAIWTETQSSVTVTAGVFQVNLGSSCPFFTANACNGSTPIDFNANPNLHLGITFNSDPAGEMSPRVQLQSVPFAFQADNASKLGGLAASNYVQLSPGSQQTGFINVSGNGTLGGNLIVQGTGTTSVAGSLAIGVTSASYQLDMRNVNASQIHLGTDGTDLGAYLLGANNGAAVLGSAVAFNGTAYVAKATIASQVAQLAGILYFQSNSGLTVGVAYTPTVRFSVDGTGNVVATGNITGVTLNGTTGINTGAAAGTQRIDASGNLLNIGTITSVGTASINATGTANTTIGNGTGTFTLNSAALDVSSAGAVSGVTDLTASGRIYLSETTGTNGEGYFIRNTTPTPIAAFQGLENGTNTFGFFAVNKYFNGTAWVDSGLSRAGSSFQIQDDSFNFYSFDTAANFTSRFILASGGNVGIGDNVTPGFKLDVQGGDINTSANLRTGDTIRLDNAGALSNIASLTGSSALTVAAGGTAQNLTLNGSTTGQVQIGGTSTGDILLGGGSGSTGCTLTNSTGAFACTAGLTATSLTGVTSLAVAAGGTAQNLTLNGSTTGQVQIGGTSTGDILLGGGSGSTGCTVTNASGNFTCTATINATGYQSGGIAGTTVAACAANAYIGNGVKVDDGLTTAGTCRTDATGISDSRLKENINDVDSALDTLNQLRAVSYNFNDLYYDLTGDPLDYGVQYGFIAQELQQVNPELVSTVYGLNDEYLGIDYNAFHALLTVAVQELDQKVTNLSNNDFTTGIVTPSLIASGALVISSGAAGNITIDTSEASAAVNIGTEQSATVNIGHAGSTTTVEGALVAEGPTALGGSVTMSFDAPDESFKISDGSSAPAAFEIARSGDVTTSGSIVSRGGGFQLLDTANQQLITFDQAGNANFKGNLNLASASLSGGLTVGGDISVAGLSTFQQLATFLGKTIFRQDVEFDGHITVAKDTAGYALVRINESTIHVDFSQPYETPPIVSASPTNGQFASYTIDQVTETGFDIKLQLPATADTKFSWTALGVIEPRTASNLIQ